MGLPVCRLGRLQTAAILLAAALLPCFGGADRTEVGGHHPQSFNILIYDSGVYRVAYEELQAAGLEPRKLQPERLGLSSAGLAVPIWIVAGEDGLFGPGDHLEFIGEQLTGERTHYNLYSPFNVYRLDLDASSPTRILSGSGQSGSAGCAEAQVLFHKTEHLEQDLVRVRFPASNSTDQEIWFWSKLTQIDAEPFAYRFELPGLERDPRLPVNIRLELRGWSSLPRALRDLAADHQIKVLLNGHTIGSAEWDNSDSGHLVELGDLPSTVFGTGETRLEIDVTPRTIGEEARPQVDVVLLNWIEISYPRSSRIEEPQSTFSLVEPGQGNCIRLDTAPAHGLTLYHRAGGKLLRDYLPPSGTGEQAIQLASGLQLDRPLHAVLDHGFDTPIAISTVGRSMLRQAANRADYIIISHPSLVEAVRPLAEFHESRGLAVKLIDVQEIYDEFNHGIVHPRAIRDFLEYGLRNWTAPSPRFVLLVGDSSWDTRNPYVEDANYADWTYRSQPAPEFTKNRSTPYDTGSGVNNRNLIPTWGFATFEGHAASDNWFVSFDGDEGQPNMAIGRFPVTTPEEVTAIVEKTIGYTSNPLPGPWRRKILWITNETVAAQVRSDKLAGRLIERGLLPHKIYPAKDEPSNERHTANLRRALDEGQLLVHFYGHGGRYIWRTGPPDLEKNHDLFTLDDLEQLEPSDRLPIVLSMTCYSAPFDHPSADSIGEKFLRLPGRGAVAVIAASWRNAPTPRTSQLLLDQLIRPGTVGEAFMRAKHESRHEDFLHQYNLLGDPALPLQVPQLPLTLTYQPGGPALQVTIEAGSFTGRALVDWIDVDGELLAVGEETVRAPRFVSRYTGEPEELHRLGAVLVYIWDLERGVDGMAGLILDKDGS